jgi:hypothetical protein
VPYVLATAREMVMVLARVMVMMRVRVSRMRGYASLRAMVCVEICAVNPVTQNADAKCR